MSTRTALRPNLLSPLNLANTGASQPTILQSLTKLNYDITWTGSSPVGTLQLQSSSDYLLAPNNTVINAGTWNTCPMGVDGAYATSIPITGNTGNGEIAILHTSGYAMRLLYTASSGTGTMSIIVSGKVG